MELFAHYTFQTDPSIAPSPHTDEDSNTFEKVVRLIKKIHDDGQRTKHQTHLAQHTAIRILKGWTVYSVWNAVQWQKFSSVY